MMGFKTGKLPHVYLMYGLSFKNSFWYTGTNIVKHHFIIFASLISRVIPEKLMYSHCYQLFDALYAYLLLKIIILCHLE